MFPLILSVLDMVSGLVYDLCMLAQYLILSRRIDTSHLRGLERVSPCCGAGVYHYYEISHPSVKKALMLKCRQCLNKVMDHLLVNDRGDVVWPPPDEWVMRIPPVKPNKRSRRKVLREEDPEPYKVIF